MLNYANLNDVEFEYLCRDVMDRILGVSLRRFSSGKDKGIDLVNDVVSKDILVQVKHYSKTSTSGLISSLKNEVPKVVKLKPKQYYVCCSKELTPSNIESIFELFSNYMSSDKNILTILEIDQFLNDSQNLDILRKHYKLWIASTNILSDLFNNDIFIDSEVLLSDIQREIKYFVQTNAYDEALKCLEHNRTLFITGDPGVGKSMTSKMIVLYYSAQGYRVRYTTNVTNINKLKNAISENRDIKEIILLDDCFGQAYFNMKESQGSELLALIKYIHLTPNKILILNSRVTIYQEAKARTPELVKSFENNEYKINVIDINQMAKKEKALIYYNHLYFNEADDFFWKSIRTEKRYRQIVMHKNYNPRIIEFISNVNHFKKSQYDSYIDFVMENLNNPQNIWHDEYTRKLNMKDRILLLTLYSLTEDDEIYDYVKCVFNHRIKGFKDMDPTINHFEDSLSRLQDSFIKIIDTKNSKRLSMVNPSINDYLNSVIIPESNEYRDIVDTSVSMKQLKRMLSKDEYKLRLQSAIKDASILTYLYESTKTKNAYVAYHIMSNKVYDERYNDALQNFLDEFDSIKIYETIRIWQVELIELVFKKETFKYYFSNYFNDWSKLERLFDELDFLELVKVVASCYSYFRQWYEEFIELLIIELEDYCYVDAPSLDVNLDEIISDNTSYYSDGTERVDIEQAKEDLESLISGMITDEILEAVSMLPNDFDQDLLVNKIVLQIEHIDSVIDGYLAINDDEGRQSYSDKDDYTIIDSIFER